MGKARSKQTAHFLAPESPPGLEKGLNNPVARARHSLCCTDPHGGGGGGMVNLHQKGHSGPSEMVRSCALEGWGGIKMQKLALGQSRGQCVGLHVNQAREVR